MQDMCTEDRIFRRGQESMICRAWGVGPIHMNMLPRAKSATEAELRCAFSSFHPYSQVLLTHTHTAEHPSFPQQTTIPGSHTLSPPLSPSSTSSLLSTRILTPIAASTHEDLRTAFTLQGSQWFILDPPVAGRD